MIRYDEFYGWNGKPNKGCRMESPLVAQKAVEMERERGETMDYRVGDTQMWAQSDGPSVQERMATATNGVFTLQQAKKDLRACYAEILARLKGTEIDGKWYPMLYATTNCRHFWRTLPGLTLDELEPDKGPSLKQEDHVYAEVTYICRSRPFVTTEQERWEEDNRESIRKVYAQDPYATA